MNDRNRLHSTLPVFVLAMLVQSAVATRAYSETRIDLAQAPQPLTSSETSPAPSSAPPEAPPSPQSPPDQGSPAASVQDQGDPNVTPERQAFDRVLVDAAVLKNQYEESKRSRSKVKVSLSAFRSLEIRLRTFVDADPSNKQAQDMMIAMQRAQGEILGPSVAVAAAASRQVYADDLGQQLSDRGYQVSTSGRAISTLLIAGPDNMKSSDAVNLDQTEKIFDRAKMLQFDEVVFRNKRGRRVGRFDVSQDRFAKLGSDKNDASVEDKNSNVGAGQNAGSSEKASPRRRTYRRRAVRLPNLLRFIRRVL